MMEYKNNDTRRMPDNDREDITPRMDMNRNDRRKMGRENEMSDMHRMDRNNVRITEEEKNEKARHIYECLNERMCQALSFHSQLADFFCFLGLQGFKRMAEYQYMKECAEKRKVHKRYIDMHHSIIPVEDYSSPMLIPNEWNRYTTKDINDSILPKYVKYGLTQYYEWEKETKEIYEELCEKLMQYNMYADYEYLKELIRDVEKECKKVMRMCESLNGTGYDVNAVHQMQTKYHEKYKKKYDDHFTIKNNYPRYSIEEDREPRRYTRVGY